jgi:integrase
MASIKSRRLANGEKRYDVRYRAPDGTARMRTFKTKRDAERYENTVEADKIRGAWVDPRRGKVTLEEYAKEWLSNRPTLRVRTRETYETQLRLHIYPHLGKTEIARVSPTAVRSWYAQITRDVSPSQAAKCYRLLRTILTTAVTDELMIRNPCRIEGAGIERSAERPQATPEQVFELAAAVPERYRAFILLAGFAGPRLGELLGLRSRHVDLLHATITIEQQEQQLNNGQLIIAPRRRVYRRRRSRTSPLNSRPRPTVFRFRPWRTRYVEVSWVAGGTGTNRTVLRGRSAHDRSGGRPPRNNALKRCASASDHLDASA